MGLIAIVIACRDARVQTSPQATPSVGVRGHADRHPSRSRRPCRAGHRSRRRRSPATRECRCVADQLRPPGPVAEAAAAAGGGAHVVAAAAPSKTSIRLFARSATITEPLQSTASPAGESSWPSAAPRAAPRRDEVPAASELLDPVVEPVRDEHVARRVDGHPVGLVEAPRARAQLTPRPDRRTGRRELLDPVVAGIGHVDVSRLVKRERLRRLELARPVAALAEHSRQRAARTRTSRSGSRSCPRRRSPPPGRSPPPLGATSCPGRPSPVAAPPRLPEPDAGPVESLDAVVVAVGDEDVSRTSRRPRRSAS